MAQLLGSVALCGAVPLRSPSAVVTYGTAFGSFAGMYVAGHAQLPDTLPLFLFPAVCASGAVPAMQVLS